MFRKGILSKIDQTATDRMMDFRRHMSMVQKTSVDQEAKTAAQRKFMQAAEA